MTVAIASARDLSSTSREVMDAAVRDLQGRKLAWTQVSVRDRIALIDELLTDKGLVDVERFEVLPLFV